MKMKAVVILGVGVCLCIQSLAWGANPVAKTDSQVEAYLNQASANAEDEALIKAAESLQETSTTAETTASMKSVETTGDTTQVGSKAEVDKISEESESTIPVLTKAPAQVASAESSWTRLAISFAIVIVVAGVIMFVGKRWTKQRNTIGSHAKVKVVHQHYLGPKRSLAIIEVASEHLLVGITDHNISLLKTLALIDDEVAQHIPKDLDEMMSDEFSVATVAEAVKKKHKPLRFF